MRRATWFLAGVAGVLALAACTGSGSTSDSSPSDASPASATSNGPVTTPSAVGTCSATRLTFHRHRVVTSTYDLTVAGGKGVSSRITSTGHFSPATVVRARVNGGPGPKIISSVSRHWHTTAADPGETTKTQDPGSSVTVKSRGANESFVVYRATHVYTGTFSSSCGGKRVTGRYTTFGPITTATTPCFGGHPDALDRYARHGNC